MTGWEWGNHADTESTLGTVQTTTKRSGVYALRLQAQASPGRYTMKSGLARTLLFGKAHVRFTVTASPGAPVSWDFMVLDNGSKTLGGAIRITVSAAGVVSAQGVNLQSNTVFGGSAALAAGTFHHLDLKVLANATSGEVNWRIPGTTFGSAITGNTGSGNLTHWSLFEPPNTSGLAVDVFIDDAVLDGALFVAGSSILLRNGKSGTPSADGFVKTGGAGIHTVWSELPPSATNEAHSDAANDAQTMLVADPAGGTDAMVGNDFILHAQTQILAREIGS